MSDRIPDKYTIEARYVPALICSVPFLGLGYFFVAEIDTGFTELVITQVAGGVSMMAAVFMLLVFASRHIGTWLQDRIFNAGDRFPTNLLLLDKDLTFSEEKKQQIRAKVKSDFDIDLSSYTADTASSRRRIGEAVGQIRKKYFGKPGLLHQRNIEFGLAKNLAGGSILAFCASVGIVAVSVAADMPAVLNLGVTMTAVYLALGIFGFVATRTNAKRYATVLFEEYLQN